MRQTYLSRTQALPVEEIVHFCFSHLFSVQFLYIYKKQNNKPTNELHISQMSLLHRRKNNNLIIDLKIILLF